MELSYCIVNTDGREHLLACLEAVRRTHPPALGCEVLVLDNASSDGSADAVRRWVARTGDETVRLIERDRRAGKAENDTILLRESRGDLCLLLNEDTELLPGATAALVDALDGDPGAAAAGASLLDPNRSPVPCAWRLPGIGTALASALFLHRKLVTQSGGTETRDVGWVQSAAMLVRRRAAEQVSYLDPVFFVYSDETDFCRRLHDTGWRILHVPAATAVHHEQLATDRGSGDRRVTEFHRGRDLYMRKHAGTIRAAAYRLLSAWAYLPRVLAATVLPGRRPSLFWLHARRAMRPWSAEGLRESAEAYNRRLRE